MEEIVVRSLAELVAVAREVAAAQGMDFFSIRERPQILFRGQSSSTADLRTSLERATSSRSLRAYLTRCDSFASEIKAFFNHPFQGIGAGEIDGFLAAYCRGERRELPGLDYLLYLRHFGFPSPLLDWTRSINVATGFAFFPDARSEWRAVYMLLDRSPSGQAQDPGRPRLLGVGGNVFTTKRNFAQQSGYTLALVGAGGEVFVVPHEDAIEAARSMDDPPQLLHKFALPDSCRTAILKELFSANISPFHLYGTEESLLETLKLRFQVENLL